MSKLPPNYLDVQQGSAEWFNARCGCVTASRVADVMAKLKNGKPAAARENYKLELLQEIWTGQAVEHFVTPAMDRGIQGEPLARTAYEMRHGIEVQRIGYVYHPGIRRSGASPDGLVGDSGLLEIKVPRITTHIGYLLAEEVPDEYKPQMLWQMACTDREWCDFVSYAPELPEGRDLFEVRFHRDEKAIADMEREVEQFISEVNALAEKLLTAQQAVESARPPGPPRAEIPMDMLR
jgi:putative phage-type endonuclease